MKKLLMSAALFALVSGSVMAIDLCNPCPPKPCPPQYKWETVCETIQCEVPVTTYVDEPCEIQVTKMVPETVECEVMTTKWEYVEETVPIKKKVWDCEEYTVMVKKKEYRYETRTREVCKTVVECVDKVVCKTVYDKVCDPCTGKITKVARTEETVVPVKVKKKVYVTEEYQVKVPVCIEVPVTKTRKVCKIVDDVQVIKKKVCVQVPVKSTKTVMKPVVETKTVMKKKAVTTTKMVEKQITKRVKVPVDPCGAC